MITGELKNKIDSIWEIFWTGGLTNLLDVIEQMTYMMFIHDLDDSDNLRAKEAAMLGLPYQSIFADEVRIGDRTIAGNQLKWSIFHDFPAAKMYSVVQEWVFPFIKNLHGDKDSAYAKYMGGECQTFEPYHPPQSPHLILPESRWTPLWRFLPLVRMASSRWTISKVSGSIIASWLFST